MRVVPASETIAATRLMRFVFRAAVIVLSASAIAGAAFLWLGRPALAREYHVRNEVARFAPTVGHGLLQFGGETFLLILIAYIGRRWLRVRL
jgi:hypothetical protein